jgi:hypothetical protein
VLGPINCKSLGLTVGLLLGEAWGRWRFWGTQIWRFLRRCNEAHCWYCRNCHFDSHLQLAHSTLILMYVSVEVFHCIYSCKILPSLTWDWYLLVAIVWGTTWERQFG